MAANFQTIAAVLMNDRTDKVIHSLLQNDVAAWKNIPVKGRSWSGDVAIIGLRAARNQSIVSVRGNTEPIAGEQGFLRYTVMRKKVLGRLQIDLDAVLSADDSKGSLAVEPADEISGLLEDIPRTMTRYAFLGGGGEQGIDGLVVPGAMIGLIWQRVAAPAGNAYGYRGRFDDIVATAPQAINFARFIRLDTYVQVGGDTLITALTSRTLTLGLAIDTSALPVGVPCGVMLVGAAGQAFNDTNVTGTNEAGDPVVVAAGGRPVGALIGDMTGFISNLTQPLQYGNNRANGAADARLRRLRSNFRVCNDNNAAGGDVLSGIEYDRLVSRIKTRSGAKIDAWWMSWETAVAYPDSLMGTADANVRVQAQGKAQNMDPAAPVVAEGAFATNYSRGGVPINASDLCPDGIAIAMQYASWERLFKGPEAGLWLGVNGPGGNPLVKLQGETQWAATRALLPEQICVSPLNNGILCGIADP